MTIRIFLVDDQYLMQEGIKAILRDEAEIEIVGTAKDGQEAIAKISKIKPDIVLLDMEMPKLNGIAVTKYISKTLPATQVIILSGHGGQNYISQALSAGAVSYLLKDSLVEDLKQAIYSVSRGYSYIEAKLLNRALKRLKANNIVNSQKKTVHTPKYRQHIYIPQAHTTSSNLGSSPRSLASESQQSPQGTPGINRQSLAPIFESSSEIKSNAQLVSSLSPRMTAPVAQHRPQRKIKKLVWSLLAIASCILVILIL